MCSHFVFIFRYTSIPTLTMFRNKNIIASVSFFVNGHYTHIYSDRNNLFLHD